MSELFDRGKGPSAYLVLDPDLENTGGIATLTVSTG